MTIEEFINELRPEAVLLGYIPKLECPVIPIEVWPGILPKLLAPVTYPDPPNDGNPEAVLFPVFEIVDIPDIPLCCYDIDPVPTPKLC